jgi:hypothetical protein
VIKGRRLISIAAILLMAAAGLIGYYFLGARSEIRLPVVESCALHLEACVVTFPEGGRMTFEITPKQPSATQALVLNASFEQMEPQAVGARFKGVEMNMGYLDYYVYDLHKIGSNDKQSLFSGNAGVFVCSNNRMEWLVLVKVQVGETFYEVPFRFETRLEG